MNLNGHKDFLIGNYAPPAIEVVRGEGVKVWDSNGKEYLDFTSGIAVTNLRAPRAIATFEATVSAFTL